MKKLMLTIGLAALLASLTGCQNTPQTIVGKSEGAIIVTVDSGMKAFADAANQGRVTQAQVDAVRKNYGTYYNAQQIAKAALEKWIASKDPADKAANDTAQAAVSNAESALLEIINQFLTKK
jgi:hypothetical protein